jgi:hypothetical protein
MMGVKDVKRSTVHVEAQRKIVAVLIGVIVIESASELDSLRLGVACGLL